MGQDADMSMSGSAVAAGEAGRPRWSATGFRTLVSWSVALSIVALLGIAYAGSFAYLLEQWTENDNYSHGWFVPAVVVALIWMRREQVLEAGTSPSWWGVVVALGGFALYVVGELATLYVLLYLSLWMVFVGLLMASIGPRACRQMAFPLGYLLTMFPLPQMVEQNLSASLQLASSALGVGCLQLIGVTAFREGNVIDLGSIQLQVVEACSGLRYLFPLTSLALLCGYLFQDSLWKKIVLVASAVPLAILLNGVRIGLIGVLVEWHGQGAAEGFMHAFEGWVVFVVSFAALLGEMWLLARVGRAPVRTVHPAAAARPAFPRWAECPGWSAALAVCLLIVAGQAALSFALQDREELAPPRQSFLDFPMDLDGWKGVPMTLERQYVDVLRFDDYLLADYAAPSAGPVNLYIAYYRSQKTRQSAHSPKTCLPGGGWEMTSLTTASVSERGTGRTFPANRVLIQKGEDRQVVWYWFKQRDRLVTNEYLVKALLVWDGLTRRRSDGALVRLVAPLRPGEDERAADERLSRFAALVGPRLAAYVPD